MKKKLQIITLLTLGAFTFNAKAQTIPNASFETWADTTGIIPGSTITNPVGWITSNLGLSSLGIADGVTKSTDKHSGSYAVKLAISSSIGSTMPGLLEANLPTTQKAAYLNGYCKSSIIGTDSFMLGVYYSNSVSGMMLPIGQMATASRTNWSPFNIAINLPTSFTPDSVTIFAMVTGSGATYGILDDLSFSNTAIGTPFGNNMTVPTAVNTISQNKIINSSIYPNPASGNAEIDFSLTSSSNINIKIYDVTGRLVKTVLNDKKSAGSQQVQVNVEELQNGIYFYTIAGDGFSNTKKFIVSK